MLDIYNIYICIFIYNYLAIKRKNTGESLNISSTKTNGDEKTKTN